MSNNFGLSKFCISVLILFTTEHPSYAASPASKKSINQVKQVWLLKQQSPIGRCLVYVSADAMRIDDLTHHYSLLCKAPLWKVSMFRSDEKVVFEESLTDWLKMGSTWYSGATYYVPPNSTSGSPVRTKFNGIDCLKSFIPDHSVSTPAPDLLATYKPKARTTIGHDYYVKDEIKTSPRLAQFLQKRYLLPSSPYVPIAFKTQYANALPSLFVSTTSVTQQPEPPAIFEYPQGYRKIDHEWTVIVGEKKNGSVNGLIEDLGLGSEFGSEKDKSSKKTSH